MEKLTIKTFNEKLVNELSKYLINEGYNKYKPTLMAFEKTLDSNIFRICIYTKKWSQHFSIQIHICYWKKITGEK